MDANEINDFEEIMDKMDEQRKQMFGVEAAIRGILWDGQIEDEEFDNTMSQLITLIREIVESEDLQSDLFTIDISRYEDADADDYLDD